MPFESSFLEVPFLYDLFGVVDVRVRWAAVIGTYALTVAQVIFIPPSVEGRDSSVRPVTTNVSNILPAEGAAHHSNAVCITTSFSNFREHPSLLKNPSTPLPGLLQGLKTPAIAVLALMPKCLDAVLDHRLV